MRIAIALTALVVAGCGGDGRPEISTTQDSVCSDLAEVACFDIYQCCSEGEIEATLGLHEARTQTECNDDVNALCERQLATYRFSIKNKRVKFDAKLMNACLAAFVAPKDTCSSIAATKPWTEACADSAWTGTVDNGGACDYAYECGTDSFCSSNRVCTAKPGDGMACSQQGCATGLFCNAGTCRPLLASGAVCIANAQCQKGLFCDLPGTGTCLAQHANGEACTTSAACTSATCLPGTCAGIPNTCFANTACSAHCADDNSFCTDDSSCQAGTCSISAAQCSTLTPCAIGAGTCVFPVKCLPAQCVGPVVCADPHVVVDYCQDPLDEIRPF